MAFFPRNFYNSGSSFTPLFRLLEDFDNYNRQGDCQPQGRLSGLPSWQPKFDVHEKGDSYVLHGELPGVEKDNVHIEFTDPQTMLVRGRVERTFSMGTPPAGHIEDGAAVTECEDSSARSSNQVTVEDENEAATSTQRAASGGHSNDAVAEHKKPAHKDKYWLTERSVGEFSRCFSFPTRIDQDAVSASLKNGVLSITVPKAKKHESRRIAIN